MNTVKKSLSDWLIASDIDGTLNNKFRQFPKRNYYAIQKYVKEYGGNFILSSGRSVPSMRKHINKLDIGHPYAVFTNGAGVYDYKNEKTLWLCPIDAELQNIIINQINKHKGIGMLVITDSNAYILKYDIGCRAMALNNRFKVTHYKKAEDMPKENWCKVIFCGLPHRLKKFAADFKEANGGVTTNLMHSSIVSFEVVSKDTNKGKAVLKAAELMGIDKNKTAAIGDYFNDYEMLKSVALPACCGQAPDEMKKISKLVTCHCNKGAVADLIEYIIANRNNL